MVAGGHRDDGDCVVLEVSIGKPRAAQELRQRLIEGQVARRAACLMIADEFGAIYKLNIPLFREGSEGRRQALRRDVGLPSNGGFCVPGCCDGN